MQGVTSLLQKEVDKEALNHDFASDKEAMKWLEKHWQGMIAYIVVLDSQGYSLAEALLHYIKETSSKCHA